MAASRHPPVIGASARVHRLGHVDDVLIVAVDGREVTVEMVDGEQLLFVLHRGKGHFYLAGDAGSTGPRLQLSDE